MTTKLRIVLAQLNLCVGDIQSNLKKHIEAALTARDQLAADVIVFPELSLTGYPPEDLLLRPSFIQATQSALQQFISEVKGIYCLVAYPQSTPQGLYNACSLIHNGSIIAHYAKQCLPNYGVFDEARYFIPADKPCVALVKDIPVGIVICEDAWSPQPIQQTAAEGARLVLIPNASPFETNKHEQRLRVLAARAKENHLPILYVNNVGGQDELVFDGGSMLVNEKGELSQFAGFFNETLFPIDIDLAATQPISKQTTLPNKEEKTYQALVMGLRDYVEKNRFPGVIVGASGGIDSALTLAIAVDALGKDRVRAVRMPSRYTTDISMEDARELIHALDISSETISIEPTYHAFLESLASSFKGKSPDVTEENIQARCRAIILMALSNKSGWLVLTTGNRSEIAVGYCTLYGDMAGGYAVLKDVYKTFVYDLARYRNQLSAVIPTRTLERAPTAELAPNQKDEDSLPPYPVLDKILEYYLDQSQSIDEIVSRGLDRETVVKIVNLIHRSEYKRKQAAIGTHINHKSFGKDWRYPLTNRFKG
ncbi:MAG: NAD+ synthase [Gammaproteobacteria bacterium]|nr:MAG: NAD+ synthase [Gammaproteobacteria bacterium]